MSELLRCQGCGGAVVWDPARVEAACLFCGRTALTVEIPREPLPEPEAVIPFVLDPEQAAARFRTWASRSWFRPAALRRVALRLEPVLLPAWRFDSELETHWAGLRRAPTKSGRSPVAGLEHARLRQLLPASMGLSRAELDGLLPFDESKLEPWSGGSSSREVAWEPPALTRHGARRSAHRALAQRHRRTIARTHGLTSCAVSPVIEDLDVRLMMVPVYLGTLRFRDRPWRFVVNGQSGAATGRLPVDRLKVGGLVLGALVLAILIAWLRS